jgi:hypothetical protein
MSPATLTAARRLRRACLATGVDVPPPAPDVVPLPPSPHPVPPSPEPPPPEIIEPPLPGQDRPVRDPIAPTNVHTAGAARPPAAGW